MVRVPILFLTAMLILGNMFMGKHKVMVSIDGRMAIFIVELLFKVKRKEKAVGESLD